MQWNAGKWLTRFCDEISSRNLFCSLSSSLVVVMQVDFLSAGSDVAAENEKYCVDVYL